MMNFRTAAAAVLAAAAIATTGAVAAPALASAAPFAPMRTQAPAPAAGELRGVLATALDPGNGPAARAAVLESGAAGLPLFDTLATLLAIAPPSFRWDVTGAGVNGDVAYGTLYTATDGYEPWTTSLEFKYLDGRWKLSQQGQCALAAFLQQAC